MEQREGELLELSGQLFKPEQVSVRGMQEPSAHWNWESRQERLIIEMIVGKRVMRSTVEKGRGGSILRKGLELALWFPYLISQSLQVSGVTVRLIYRSITPVSRKGWCLAGAVWVSYGN